MKNTILTRWARSFPATPLPRHVLPAMIGLLFHLAIVLPVTAQNVIVHKQLSEWEDGTSPQDADGTKNGVVVWRGGAVHVVRGSYTINAAYGEATGTLVIESNATVKVAGEFIVDDKGNLTSWTPTSVGSGYISCGFGGIIRIEGATITDIRDDTDGDTNQDGSATTPSQWGFMALSGTDRDVIHNNTIKYLVKMGNIGSIQITENRFLHFQQGLESTSSYPGHSGYVVLNATPLISKNLFEFDGSPSYRGGHLDLRGMSPVVVGNTIRNAYTAIEVGPRLQYGNYPDESAGPTTGTTIVSNNTIEQCSNGISVAAENPRLSDELIKKTPPFKAEVSNNKLRGDAQGFGLSVGFSAVATISGNDVANFGVPLNIYRDTRYDLLDPSVGNGLQILNNRFSKEGSYGGPQSPGEKYWTSGVYVNAKHNYWGDPSGPLDNSNKDQLYNPHGRGIIVGDGIDYKPFIGGSAPPVVDALRITASCSASPPLAPKSSATFTVAVDYYELRSAPAGQIIALVRDQDGKVLNGTGTMMAVNSQNHSVSFTAIPVTVPEFASQLRVEAMLSPDGASENVYSNPVTFMVNKPPSAFVIKSVVDAGTGQFPQLSTGRSYQIRFAMTYTLASTGNGQFEFDLKEREAGTGAVLRDLPLATVGIAPGSKLETQKDVQVELPERDAEVTPRTELYYQITMKDDAGAVAGSQSGVLPTTSNRVGIFMVVPGMIVGDRSLGAGRLHFLVGETPVLWINYEYNITSPNVTNWQVIFGPIEVLDAKGTVVHSYPYTRAHLENLATGYKGGPTAALVLREESGQPIPPGARKVRLRVRMVDPTTGTTVAVGKPYEVEVREVSQTVHLDFAAGVSQASFSPIPVKLNFSYNQNAGGATVEEFRRQFGAAAASGTLAKPAGFYWGFIPLNRYWSVYDTLKEGTFVATVSFTYNPDTDLPAVPGFSEDSLVVAGLNPMSGELEPLASTFDRPSHTLTTEYVKPFDTFVIASRATLATTVDPHEGAALPERCLLEQNYPNPFNPSTQIKYTVGVASGRGQVATVKLVVYDLLGREVAVLVNEKKAPETYEVTFDASGLSSGVYFYRLQAGEFVQTRKLLLVR